MVQINPLRALRPDPAMAQKIVSEPYDVMDRAEARAMAADNPQSYLRIIRSDLEFDDSEDQYAEAVYAKALQNLKDFESKGWLLRDTEPGYYIYRLNSGSIQQTGLVAGSAIEDYNKEFIKKHEFTRPDKERDRTTHIDTLGANTGPVFLLYKNQQSPEIASLMDACADKNDALYDLSFEDGVRHRIYRVGPGKMQDNLSRLFGDLPATYIADGHHRAASAYKNGAARLQARPDRPGNDPARFFLTVIFPDEQLAILPYNRAIKDLNGLSAEELQTKISEHFEIKSGKHSAPEGHTINMYLSGAWFQLQARSHTYEKVSIKDHLTVSVLQNYVLSPLLGIEDPRTSDRIKFVGGIRGDAELERLVKSGEFAVAFGMPPVRAADLTAIADEGLVMPPKSTWFEPKLRSGFITHLLDR